MKRMTTFILFLMICSGLSANTKYLVEISVGDSSCDGHCSIDKFLIRSSILPKTMSERYKKIIQKYPHLDIKSQVNDYQDNSVSLKTYDSIVNDLFLVNARKHFTCNQSINEKDRCAFKSTKSYLIIYLQIIQRFYRGFNYRIIESQLTHHIGGYGLLDV